MRLWLRELRARPLLVILMLSMAVSLGGGLTALSLYAAVQWRVPPFPDPDRLLSLEVHTAAQRARWWSGPELQSLSDAPPPGVDSVAGFTVADYNVLSEPGRPPEALLGTLVSPSFFQVLKVDVSLGRAPEGYEFIDGGPHVVVLGHALWQRRYGGDPSIVGRTIRLSAPEYLGEPDTDYRVIGVLDADTWLFWKRTDLLLPVRAANGALANPDTYLIERVIARTAGDAGSVRVGLGGAIEAMMPSSREPAARVMVTPLATALFRDLRPQLLLVLVVACLVLALAVVNMAIALTADALSRRRQDAVRSALGATALRLACDAAGRIALTAGAAGLASLFVTAWLLDAAVAVLPSGWLARVPGAESAIRVSGPVLVGLTGTLAVLIGSVGAWTYRAMQRISIGSLLTALQPADGPRHQRWRSVLAGIEIALCTAMVIVATSLAAQLGRARGTDLGVDTDRTVAAWINASPTTYADARSRAAYFDRIVDRIERGAGIQAAGAVSLPFHFNWHTIPVRPDAATTVAPFQALDRSASPAYAGVAGLRVLDGRWFERADDAGGRGVVVVSAALAEALWPAQRVVGRTVALGVDAAPILATVIGVVSDTRTSAHAEPSRTLYRPLAQAPPPWIYVTARTAPGADVSRTLTEAVWAIDPNQPVDGPWSVQSWVEGRTSELSFIATTAVALAMLGALLAGMGLLGLTLHWVNSARRELGIRRAVGATDTAILWWFTRRWLAVLAPAVVLGAALHALLLRTTVAAVEGIRLARPAEVVFGALAVTLVAAASAQWGVRRALRVDPRELVR